jgi:cobalt-zinc-cadmium efflux system outer membrane protein
MRLPPFAAFLSALAALLPAGAAAQTPDLPHPAPAPATAPAHEHEHASAPATGGTTLDVAAVRHRAEALGPGVLPARAGRAHAGHTRDAVDVALTHPPRVEIDMAHRAFPGGSGLDVTARLWQDVSLGGYRGARLSYADALVERSHSLVELARRDAIARALHAWAEARWGRELLVVRRHSALAAEQLLRIAQARVRAGSAAPAEAALARAIVGASHAAVLAAEGQIIEADGELRYALALSPDARLDPVGALARTDDRDVDQERTVQAAQAHHPNVLIARAHARLADRSAEVASALGRPFLGVGASYSREATGDRIVGGMVSIPLPFVNPTVLEASLARGEAAVSRAVIGEVQAQVAREVRQAIHERHHAREVREELRKGAVEPGHEALREMTRRYEQGAVELASVLATRREVLLAEEGFLAAAADVQHADIRLEHAVGGPVPRKGSR